MIRFVWMVCGLCVCLPAWALQCMPTTPVTAVTAQAKSVRESVVLDCRLGDERGLSLGGELVSTLVWARGSFRITFMRADGRPLWRTQRGPWLGQFAGLVLDETLPVPVGATRVRVVAAVESARPDAGGMWQVTGASLNPGVVATLDAPDGTVVVVGKGARWAVQTASGSPAASVQIEVRSQEGAVLHQIPLNLPAGGGQNVASWPTLPVGYYDISAVVSAVGVRSTTLRSSIAVVSGEKAPYERRFGMDAALSWYGGGGTREQIARSVTMMQQAGVGTVRDRLSWSNVQPIAGGAQWDHYAKVAAAVTGAGLDALQVFHDSPAWARGGAQGSGDRQPPTDDAAAYAFGRAYAQGLGKTVRSIEYWNEPNSSFFPGYPYQYASGLKAFSAGVKSVDPGIRVLIGAAAGKPGRFFDELYRNNLGGFFDARNQHYYGKSADVVGFVADEVADLERRGGVAARPGWLTEMGYSLMRDARGDWRKAEREQAEYLVKTYAAGFAAGYERVFFFFWRELIEAELHTWGIVREDFSPRPAYVALAILTRHLAGASLAALETRKGGMTVYFRQPTGSYSAVTWGGGDAARFGGAAQAKDIYGRALDLQKGLPTDGKPVLLSGIAKLPNSARMVVTRSAEPLPEATLRVSADLSVAGKSVLPASENRVAVSVGDGDTLVLSGRVFAPTVLADGGPLRVQCSAGEGLVPLTVMSPPATSLGKDGAPFSCRFKATLSAVGESYIEVSAEHGGKKDVAHVALVPDAGRVVSSAVRVLVDSGACLKWTPRSSRNVEMTLASRPTRDADCPSIDVMSRVVSSGETWVFPVASVKGKDLLNATGVRVTVGDVDGVASPPTPLRLELVERSGGIWLVDLQSSAIQNKFMSGLFNLARPASWARDDNGRLDLDNVREVMLGWGGYGGQIGQRHGFSIKSIELFSGLAATANP